MDDDKTMANPTTPIAENDEFNRTVAVTKPDRRNAGTHATPLRKIVSRFGRKTEEIEDIIGGTDLSRYTKSVPDTTAQLSAPLSHLDTRYSMLEEFAQGGMRRSPSPATATSAASWRSNR